MKAIVYTTYGSPDVLRFTDVAKPVPKDNQVLIQVRAAALNALDYRLMRGKPWIARLIVGGLFAPKNGRPGVDVAGVVEAVGRKVTRVKVGDEVFGACQGSCAEYACTAADRLALKPAGVSFDAAASVPVAAISALQGLRDEGRMELGHHVLIDGASGGVGTFSVQMAKAFGAEVTAVCSTAKMDAMRSLGADHVIDYTREDFTQGSLRYDIILGANAYHSLAAYRRALRPRGVYVMVGGGTVQMVEAMMLGPMMSLFARKKVRSFIARVNAADLDLLRDFLAERKIVPVIDRRYPLRETADAIRYLEEGHASGKVMIAMEGIGSA